MFVRINPTLVNLTHSFSEEASKSTTRMLRRSNDQLESLNFSFTECVPATETRIVVLSVFHPRYNY